MLIGWIFFYRRSFSERFGITLSWLTRSTDSSWRSAKRPDESELEIGEPVVQRLDEEFAEPAVDMDADPLPEDLPDAPEAVENGAKDTASVKRT